MKKATPTAVDLMQSAFLHFQSGQLQQANALCQYVLKEQPKYTDALHLLGGRGGGGHGAERGQRRGRSINVRQFRLRFLL